MSCKFLVNKKFITVSKNRYIYNGLVFDDEKIYYPNVFQLFNGIDFNGDKEIDITNRVQVLLSENYDLDFAILILKKELNYERKLFEQIKFDVCYFNVVNIHSKPFIIKSVKTNASSYLQQVKYYLEQNSEDYNNPIIENINQIITNSSNNNRLWRKLKEQSRLKI